MEQAEMANVDNASEKAIGKSEARPDNVFLKGSLTGVFARTAAPIILVMLVNGLFNLVDA